ncbi:MAG: nucleoside phosphorylase [Microbacteriaceae bacterium]|jgi:uridine phosphorylase|nr:nucleoside phosphorylase [Microbacteriaceae bacterium]HPU02653.1 nucleoside phosphorylase [Rhodoglobus sp.]
MSASHDEDVQYHVQLRPGDVGRYVLLPGDPGRCEPIAALFDDAAHISSNREYTTWTGSLDGEKVSVVSTGIGCPSAAIAVEELIKLGADTFIRVGTSGAMQPDTPSGQLAIVTAAIRDEGTSSHYLPMEFPAVASPQIVDALAIAARTVGADYRLGVTQSKDSFFGEVEPERMPMAAHLADRWNAWIAGGAICSEMEAAAIFVISSINRVRAGGIMHMWSEGGDADADRARMLEVSVESLRVLIAQDRAGAQWP